MTAVQLLTTDESELWHRTLPATASVFGSVEYARITQEHTGDRAHLFVVESQGATIAYPFFLRSINSLPFAQDVAEPLWDIATPEYTGPIVTSHGKTDCGTYFADHFSTYCKKHWIIAEFAHLHPFSRCSTCLVASGIEKNREIVYVDLLLSEEELWRYSFTHACRKNITRAQRENVRVFPAQTPAHIQEFHRIYLHTMERNGAQARYYYPLDYFMAFFEQMPNNARFQLAEYRDRIVAGTLYLHDDVDVYSYLGGADESFQEIRPTNAVIYDIIRWSQQQGKKRLILGGGYRHDDGIFRFKGSFSPLRARFDVYKRVHLPHKYKELCQTWTAYHGGLAANQDYFPIYRNVRGDK